jgi:hypothetical protein
VEAVHKLHRSSPAELKARREAERCGVPFLVLRDGDGRQRIVELDGARARLRIGRSASSDLALTWDDEVSRAHTEVERIGDVWTLVDDGRSRNGSFVNGQRVHGRVPLRSGDVVRVGHTRLTYHAPAGSAEHSTAVAASDLAPPVTAAQRRVLVALCRPMFADPFAMPPSNRDLARDLFLSVETVKDHLHALFTAFELGDLPQHQKRTTLARRALERGVVTEGELLDDRRG